MCKKKKKNHHIKRRGLYKKEELITEQCKCIDMVHCLSGDYGKTELAIS